MTLDLLGKPASVYAFGHLFDVKLFHDGHTKFHHSLNVDVG